MKRLFVLAACVLISAAPASAQTTGELIETTVEHEVADVERAFAKTMADRDFEAFSSFIGEDAVFVSGPQVLRGKAQVTAAWKALYAGEAAPFSWKPETVIALPSGDLALSTGPVASPDGQVGAYYTSTWAKNEAGEWKIIFDKGQDICPSKPE